MKSIKFLIVGCVLFVTFYSCKPSENQSPDDTKKTYNTSAFTNGSGITMDSITDFQLESVALLGKIWGVMKYYHPSVSKGNYHWDDELFRIMPVILNAENKKSRSRILRKWIQSYGKLTQASKKLKTDTALVKMYADFQWIENDTIIDKRLKKWLKKLTAVKSDSVNHYFDISLNRKAPWLHNEKIYTEIYPDAGYRLLALFRYWNIIQYYFPYRYLIGEDWEKVLAQFIPVFINAENAGEYQTALLQLITRINDSHATIYEGGIALDSIKGIRSLPVKIAFIENRAVIADIYNKEWSKKTKLMRGDIITKINGISIDEIITQRKSITPASNESVLLRSIAYDLLRTNDSTLQIEYKQNESTKTELVETILNKQWFADILHAKKVSYSILSKNIGYINMGLLTPDSVEFIMNKLKESQGIILDLRYYPFYSPRDELGFFLFPKPTPFAKYTRSSTFNPGEFTYKDSLKIGVENPDYYKGKIAILMNENSISSAEFYVMAFRTAPNTMVIGSRTAGADGNVLSFPLPGNITTNITGIGIYYPDGAETQRIGIIPDIEIKPTIKGFREDRDEILEKAIEWIKEK